MDKPKLSNRRWIVTGVVVVILIAGYMSFSGYRTSKVDLPISKVELPKVGGSGLTENSLKVKIVDPQDDQTVLNAIAVRGTIEGAIPSDNYLWLLVGEEAVNLWWPQGGGSITPIMGEWSTTAFVGGGSDLDIGKEQQIVVILVNEEVNKEFKGWMEAGLKTGDWPGLRLPSGMVLDKVNVVKGKG